MAKDKKKAKKRKAEAAAAAAAQSSSDTASAAAEESVDDIFAALKKEKRPPKAEKPTKKKPRRDAEAEARLRAAEKARRAASAALERRDAELREVRAKKRADAKREVFRRDYAAKAALRVKAAAKEGRGRGDGGARSGADALEPCMHWAGRRACARRPRERLDSDSGPLRTTQDHY